MIEADMRKKLIEVSLPLEAINRASAREKSIRHGHPSTLHLWWARRPLAACRAVLFAQLVDDPSAWPDEFPTGEDQERERSRLHRVITDLVQWEATNDETVLHIARCEIARSIARGRREPPPAVDDRRAVLAYLAEHAPPVCDPFCGGGSIPLEAQRLGLRAFGSDLNPVAVLVSKATCEIPPKFAGRPPIHPHGNALMTWKGAQGLAEDIRYYGEWLRNEAEARIGRLYPKVTVTEAMAVKRPDLKRYVGTKLTVIAWLWVRTVTSPDPILRGAHVPMASSFVLSLKKGKEAIVVPRVDRQNGTFRFTVKADGIAADELTRAKQGTKASRGSNFSCLVSGAPISGKHIKLEGRAGRLGIRLMAVVAEGQRGRVYFDPTEEMEETARTAEPGWRPEQSLPQNPRWFSPPDYGMPSYGDLFTDRQLVALTTFSDLVAEAKEKVLVDALAANLSDVPTPLRYGGTGAKAYAEAVSVYLAFMVGQVANHCSTICGWNSPNQQMRSTFSRQAIPMTWDFAEANVFSTSSGSFHNLFTRMIKGFETLGMGSNTGAVSQADAQQKKYETKSVISTDPPYYDNIGYADLSDFFYVWHRRTLREVWPDLFRRLQVPKDEELVATPYRHEGKEAAERFFMEGIANSLANMHASASDNSPITIYYAFKQAEFANEGFTSPGWATFLQGVVDSGYVIGGTWPVRTERAARSISIGTNALASSVVLVCRKRSADVPVITRRDFVARLRATLPEALVRIRAGGVGPVDMAQAAIGPGMGVFTAASQVLEPDDTPMTVRTAIALINQVRDEISGEEATNYDADTRFCIDWFDAFGTDDGKSGEAITMAQAYGIGIVELETAVVFRAKGGIARLLRRDELPEDWDPALDKRLTDWECAQHLARVLESPTGGVTEAARLYARMPPERADAARLLSYRLYDICERKDRAAEAQVWNMLAQEWVTIEEAATETSSEDMEELLPL